jgi:hypothetical protein
MILEGLNLIQTKNILLVQDRVAKCVPAVPPAVASDGAQRLALRYTVRKHSTRAWHGRSVRRRCEKKHRVIQENRHYVRARLAIRRPRTAVILLIL